MILPKAKKHKPMDDEAPQNEPGTSSNTQPPVPVVPLQSGSTSSSHHPSTSTASTSAQRTSTSTSSEDESADNDDAHGEEESGPAIQSARSHDSGKTVHYPDLYVLTNHEHWTNDALLLFGHAIVAPMLLSRLSAPSVAILTLLRTSSTQVTNANLWAQGNN